MPKLSQSTEVNCKAAGALLVLCRNTVWRDRLGIYYIARRRTPDAVKISELSGGVYISFNEESKTPMAASGLIPPSGARCVR